MYETVGGLPTIGITYAKMIEHLRQAQECASMMAHLHNTSTKDAELARTWLMVEDQMKRMINALTALAMGRMQ